MVGRVRPLFGRNPTEGEGAESSSGYAKLTRPTIPNYHAPAWEPIPESMQISVCIPTEDGGNEKQCAVLLMQKLTPVTKSVTIS